MQSHDRAIKSVREAINAYESAIRKAKNRITPSVQTFIIGEAKQSLDRSASFQGGDGCLARYSVGNNLTIYHLSLDAGKAAPVEECVLKQLRGSCNVIGFGSFAVGRQQVKSIFENCEINPDAAPAVNKKRKR